MRRLCDCRPSRNGMWGRLDPGVAVVSPQNGVDCVEDRDMNNRHGAAGTAGSELFAEHAIFAGSNGGVIQPVASIAIWFHRCTTSLATFGFLLEEGEGWG